MEFLYFLPPWIINTEPVSLHWETGSWKEVLLLCFAKKRYSWKWLSVKLPAANECYCSYYGLLCITWKYSSTTMNKSWLCVVAKLTKAKLQIFLSLPLLLTMHHQKELTEGCFAYWMLGRKNDKPYNFDMNNKV